MAKTVENINPLVLKWARERKHYEPAIIANKIGSSVNEEILMGWEEGRMFPTYPQLERLADIYKVPIAVFFFPEPPHIEDAIASLRSAAGFNLDLVSQETLNVIHRVQATQMVLRELNDGVNPVVSAIHKKMRLDSYDISKVDHLAMTLRKEDFLNISLEEQLQINSYIEALESWRDAIEKQGIFVFRWPFRSTALSGFCLYDEEFPVICLDSQEVKGRQIFTLLHELAHLLHGKSSVTSSEHGIQISEDSQGLEHYFDSVAGSALVPLDDLKRQVSQGNSRSKDFYTRVARLYKVTPLMLLVRCKSNNLISHNIFLEMKESFKKYNREDKTGDGGDYYWNNISYWGKAFLQNLFTKHRQNRISENEMSQVLNMKIKNIEKLEGYLVEKQLGRG